MKNVRLPREAKAFHDRLVQDLLSQNDRLSQLASELVSDKIRLEEQVSELENRLSRRQKEIAVLEREVTRLSLLERVSAGAVSVE